MLGDMSGEVRVPWFAMEKHSTLGQQKPEEDMLPPYLPRGGLHSNPTVTLITISFTDPRSWTRDDVCLWVTYTLFSHNLPCPSVDRFLMNGKAVCLMSVNMFTARVPIGGKMLYRDFQIRLAEAMAQ